MSLDVYRDWLGIQETARPLSHYQLLKLNQFEDNSMLARKQYRDLNALVRKHATSETAAPSQRLLNELAKAMLCLTDAARKLEYDISLGRKVESSKARRSLEDILTANKIVPAEEMGKVKKYADAVGIDLHEAVLQKKLATPEIVMMAYAESIGLPFVDLNDVGVDPIIAPQINPNTARMHSFVPLMSDQGTLILSSPKPISPDVEEELRMLLEMPVRCTLCTPAQINAAIAQYYPRDAVQVKVQKNQTATTTAARKKTAEKSTAPRAAKAANAPLSPEDKKQQVQMILMVGAFTVAGVSVVGSLTGHAVSMGNLFYLLALFAGGVAAGVTWVVQNR